jgi:hypothetical protein
MSIESDGLNEVLIEDCSDEEDELCPCCNDLNWLRLVAAYPRGACWVIYCGSCGKSFQERWNIIP